MDRIITRWWCSCGAVRVLCGAVAEGPDHRPRPARKPLTSANRAACGIEPDDLLITRHDTYPARCLRSSPLTAEIHLSSESTTAPALQRLPTELHPAVPRLPWSCWCCGCSATGLAAASFQPARHACLCATLNRADQACKVTPQRGQWVATHQRSPWRGRIPACGCAPDRTQPRRPSLTQRRASLELTAMRMRTVIAVLINTRNLTSATALRSISCVTASTVHTTMRAIRAQAW